MVAIGYGCYRIRVLKHTHCTRTRQTCMWESRRYRIRVLKHTHCTRTRQTCMGIKDVSVEDIVCEYGV
jgi:hypothetical protein